MRPHLVKCIATFSCWLCLSFALSPSLRESFLKSVGRRDLRELPAIVDSIYKDDGPDVTLVLASLDALNHQKFNSRVRQLGLSYISHLVGITPPQHLQMGILRLELMVRRSGQDSVLSTFQQVALPLELEMPSSSEFGRLVINSTWLSWPTLSRLCSALKQQQPETSSCNLDVIALAVLDGVAADRYLELQMLRCIENQSANLLLTDEIASICNATTQSQTFSDAAALLDAAVTRAYPPAPTLDFLLCGGTKERWQNGLSWSGMRKSSILNAALADMAAVMTVPAAIKRLSIRRNEDEGEPEIAVVCLGDGDFSHALALHSCLNNAGSFRVCATSLLSESQFTNLYQKHGLSNLAELKRRGTIDVFFNVDVTKALPSELYEKATPSFVIFNFPFADAATKREPLQNQQQKQQQHPPFDTHMMSTGRHVELLASIFKASRSILQPSASAAGNIITNKYVLITLRMRQAVSWEVQRIATDEGFQLDSILPFDDKLYKVVRTNVDASFPPSDNDSSFTFFFQMC